MAQEAARVYWRFTVLWLIIGSALGILCALSLFTPEFLKSHHMLGYGRLVAAHRACMVYGAMFSAVFATGYSLLPRLTQTQVVSGKVSLTIAWLGAIIIVLGVLSIINGHGSGREYADLPVWLATLFWFYLIAVAIDIVFMVTRSRVMQTHPGTGFLFVAIVIPAVVYPFTLPDWWGVGLFDSLRVWIGWRTIFITCFVSAALGLGIWYLGSARPKVKLSSGAFILGACLIIGLGPLMGSVHLLDAPLWSGLKIIGAFAGVLTATGLLLMVSIMWRGQAGNPPSLFYFGGLLGIAAASVQGIVMVVPPIHTAFHFTSNTSGHAHLALGALVLIYIAGGLLLVPRLSRVKLAGSGRATAAAGFIIAGLFLLFIFQTSAGVLQASAFSKGLSAPDWLPMFRWLHLGVLVGGLAMFAGFSILGGILLPVLSKPIPDPVISIAESGEAEDEETLIDEDDPEEVVPEENISEPDDDEILMNGEVYD